MTTLHRFTTTLRRVPGKGGWTYVSVPKKKTPPNYPRVGARVKIAFSFDDD